MASVNGSTVIPLAERREVYELSDRELLEELVRIARTLEAAVMQLSKHPMVAGMGAMFQ